MAAGAAAAGDDVVVEAGGVSSFFVSLSRRKWVEWRYISTVFLSKED